MMKHRLPYFLTLLALLVATLGFGTQGGTGRGRIRQGAKSYAKSLPDAV